MRPARIGQGHFLRRRDDHGSIQRRLLDQGQLHVAGAGRQVDDQDVQRLLFRPPARLGQHLGDGLRRHWPAPDHGVLGLGQQADRHGFQAVRRMRDHGPVLIGGLARQAQHGRQGRAIDIGVQHPDRQAARRQGRRQIDRNRRLADAALAAGHGQDALHMDGAIRRDRRLGPPLIGRGLRQARRAARRCGHSLGGQDDRHALHARNRLQRRFGRVAHGSVQRRFLGRNFHDEARAAVGHDQPLHQSGRRQPLARLRVDHGVEGGENGGAVGHDGDSLWLDGLAGPMTSVLSP